MNNRELATFILIGTLLLFALISRSVRHGLKDVVKAFLTPKVAIPLASFAGWIAFVTWVAYDYGLWTTDLIASTVLWFLTVGMAWFINLTATAKDDDFFKRRMLEALGLGAFFEFFVNLESLPLGLEVTLQGLLLVVVALNAYAMSDPQYRPVARLTSGVLIVISLALVIYTAARLHADWQTLNWHDIVNQLLLPVWLTVAAIMALYPLALYAAYESLLVRLRWIDRPQRPSPRAMLGAVAELKFSLVDINTLSGAYAQRVTAASSLNEARQSVRDFKQARSQKRAEEAAARQRLERYTGVDGVDEHGLILDRREFASTKESLRWLATCHMGWYRQDDMPNAYRTDLLNVLGDFKAHGLPGEHGIKTRVRKDGQAWYAYRQTPSGYIFGIGANGAPPSQWFYDGDKPPSGYPCRRIRGWSCFMEPDRPEWQLEPSIGESEN